MQEELPCGYEDSLDVFRKLLLIRAWCPDRTLPQARKYIYDSLGASFLENIVLDLDGMISEADNRTPLLCLLSTGSDPTNQIEALAKNLITSVGIRICHSNSMHWTIVSIVLNALISS